MHYVISDLHGQYAAMMRMLDTIEFSDSDELYILGDIIDRGPKGLFIYDYIKDKPNIHMLKGNHEVMLSDLELSAHGKLLDYEAIMSSRKALQCMLQCERNGGKITYSQLVERGEEYTKEFLRFLHGLPFFYKITVNDKKFFLCHAKPVFYQGMTFDECVSEAIRNGDIVWDRYFFDEHLDAEYTIIHGHTPMEHIHSYCYGQAYNIDCGCAVAARLGCLRLEDMKEFYVHC